MLTVTTYIAPSNIHGFGVFTKEFIAKGTSIWKHEPNFDQMITKDQFDALAAPARYVYENHGWLDADGMWHLCGDYGRFMNHSTSPNLLTTTTACIALDDIAADTELTCNYYEFVVPSNMPDGIE